MQQWGGTGGNGAAMRHFEATGSKYPLVVSAGPLSASSAPTCRWAVVPSTPALGGQVSTMMTAHVTGVYALRFNQH
jgi:hypothetical protein